MPRVLSTLIDFSFMTISIPYPLASVYVRSFYYSTLCEYVSAPAWPTVHQLFVTSNLNSTCLPPSLELIYLEHACRRCFSSRPIGKLRLIFFFRLSFYLLSILFSTTSIVLSLTLCRAHWYNYRQLIVTTNIIIRIVRFHYICAKYQLPYHTIRR